MPFAGYEDFAACVAANGDKADPKAYCGALQAQAEKRFVVTKADDSLGVVYGWASIVEKMIDGTRTPIVDHQNDIIPGPVLEQAVMEFMKDYGMSGEMHSGNETGIIVESCYMSPEKAEAMGFPAEVAKQVPTGWWIGAKVAPDLMAKVRSGEYQMFSIQGDADVETV